MVPHTVNEETWRARAREEGARDTPWQFVQARSYKVFNLAKEAEAAPLQDEFVCRDAGEHQGGETPFEQQRGLNSHRKDRSVKNAAERAVGSLSMGTVEDCRPESKRPGGEETE